MGQTGSSERSSAIDGLRGLAVLFVLIHHFGVHLPRWLDWGPVAPNIFFLLSGFLITRSLLDMAAKPAPGDLFRFHVRRLTRLLPALYLMLAIGWFTGLEEFRAGLPWHLTFTSNFRMIARDEWSGYASHLWSLANQEQFYLLWPLILLLPARWLFPTLVAAFFGAAVFRIACRLCGASNFFLWLMLPSSLDAFAAGGFLAWLQAWRGDRPLVVPRWRWPLAAIAILCWFVGRAMRGGYGENHASLAFVDTFETVFFAWVLIEIVQNKQSALSRALSFAPLLPIGRLSYGIYLWHMLVALALSPVLKHLGCSASARPWLYCVILIAASVGVAWVSWMVLEKRCVTWGRRISAPDGRLSALWLRAARLFRRVEST